MTPRQLHISCDLFLFLLILGIVLSIFIHYNNIDKDILIIHDMFSSWSNKPLQSLHDSYETKCEKSGTYDIISYKWPGLVSGCYCESNSKLYPKDCTEVQSQNKCRKFGGIRPLNMKKWKGHYLCSTYRITSPPVKKESLKDKEQLQIEKPSIPYFELNKIKKNDICLYKFKKCGVIDTLENYLCIPETETCPLNKIEFRRSAEEQNVRIDHGNDHIEGKIYSQFITVEGELCVNHGEKHMWERDYDMINKPGTSLI
jgi:hypothetical protein